MSFHIVLSRRLVRAKLAAKNLRFTMHQLIVSLKDCPGAECHLAGNAIVAISVRFIVDSPVKENISVST